MTGTTPPPARSGTHAAMRLLAEARTLLSERGSPAAQRLTNSTTPGTKVGEVCRD